MCNAADYDATETLENGVTVRVRAIRDDDKGRVLEAFHNLEPESIYTRFFQLKKDLTDSELRIATEVDFESAVALVATLEKEGAEVIIGGSRYVVLDAASGASAAEIAFTVEEDFQGQGLASRLLRHLVYIARRKGVARFEAEVLPQNKAMLRVFANSGLRMTRKLDAGAVHVTLDLTPSP